MNDKYALRLACEDDMDAVAKIVHRAWEPVLAHHKQNMGLDLFDATYSRWSQAAGNRMRSLFSRNPNCFSVVELCKSGELVAFVTYQMDHDGSMGTLGLNAVAPQFQGQGIASMMYQFVLDQFRQAGLKFARVRTGMNDTQTSARRAYEKAGFDIAQCEVRYYMTL